jgi:hypothetical protein
LGAKTVVFFLVVFPLRPSGLPTPRPKRVVTKGKADLPNSDRSTLCR